MPAGTQLDAHGSPSPDTCRRFFHERGDISLGLLPQLLLDDARAELWGYFWYAARTADDDIEAGRRTAREYIDRLRGAQAETLAEHALERFLGRLPPPLEADAVRRELEVALEALGRERDLQGPPSFATYAAIVQVKAGVPLSILNRLLLAGEDPATIHRFSTLLAFSIQLGDDLRDRQRDRELGLHTITTEEFERAAEEQPGEPDPVTVVIAPWREAAAQWLAILALERAERFAAPVNRTAARTEALLWLAALEAGQLRDQRRPLRWPSPLGELLADGVPTSARMAAARLVLRQEPRVLGTAQKLDARGRLEALQAAKKKLPELYVSFEIAARL